MNPIVDFVKANWLTGSAGVLGWGVGFFTDIGKEHYKRKLRLREEHAREIQKEILNPIYDYLNGFYLPVCQCKVGPLEVDSEAVPRQPKHITEGSHQDARFRILSKTPWQIVPDAMPGYEYWRESEIFRRYFKDACENHYAQLLNRWLAFRDEFEAMRADCVKFADSMVVRLQKDIGLPARIAWGVPDSTTWANYELLAVFILHRQLGMDWLSLWRNGLEVRSSREQQEMLKCKTEDEAIRIIDIVDKKTKDSNGISNIKNTCLRLQPEILKLIEEFRFALARKPPLKRCPFV